MAAPRNTMAPSWEAYCRAARCASRRSSACSLPRGAPVELADPGVVVASAGRGCEAIASSVLAILCCCVQVFGMIEAFICARLGAVRMLLSIAFVLCLCSVAGAASQDFAGSSVKTVVSAQVESKPFKAGKCCGSISQGCEGGFHAAVYTRNRAFVRGGHLEPFHPAAAQFDGLRPAPPRRPPRP